MPADCPVPQLRVWLRQGRQEGGLARARFGPRAWPQHSDGVHELVDQALGDVRLADDALLVILADGAAQLVVVHGGAVLADAPQPGHLRGVLDFEDAWGSRRAQREPAVQAGWQEGERPRPAGQSLAARGARVARGRARRWATIPSPMVVVRVIKEHVGRVFHRAQEVVNPTTDSQTSWCRVNLRTLVGDLGP